MNLSPLAVQKFFDNAGNPLNGGLLFSYIAGTTTKLATYQDQSGTLNTNPIVLNFRGEANIWLDPVLVYKFVLAPANDTDPPTAPIWTVDNITAAFGILNLTQQFLGQIIYPRTLGEINALPTAVVPSFYIYPAQTSTRYGTNTAPGSTPMDAAIQAAIDSAAQNSAEIHITDLNGLSKPLLFRSTVQQNVALIGNGRVSTLLMPTAVDIKQAPQNINALIINQGDNDHLHLSKLRAFSNNAYTGQFLYCKEGGCADNSGQTLFSAVIEDCWFSFSSNNTGIFDGGFNNLQVINCVFESTKTGCFILEGSVASVAVNADLLFSNITMNECFDSFIYANSDTTIKVIISVNGLHAYNHQRGPLISITKGIEMCFHDIILEPAIGNAGSTGLFQFTDCTDVICSNFEASTANSAPKCAIGISIINGFTGKLQNGKVVATTGLQFTGTGALDLTVENVDFTGCDTAVNWLSGTLSGRIIFRGCRFNDSQTYGLITTAGTHSWDLTLYDCEVVNAGLSGTATNRNVNISTSGAVRIFRTKVGQNNGSAAAAYYFRIDGSGTFEVSQPILIGTPPTGLVDTSSTQILKWDYVSSDAPGMLQFTPTLGGTATYTVQFGRYNIAGRRLYFEGQLTVNALGTGSANVLSGLPFASSNTTNSNGGGIVYELSASAVNVTAPPSLLIGQNATTATFKGFTAAAAADGTVSIMGNGTNIRFQGSYPLPA